MFEKEKKTTDFKKGVRYVINCHTACFLLLLLYSIINYQSVSTMGSGADSRSDISIWILNIGQIVFYFSIVQFVYTVPILIYFCIQKQWQTFKGALSTALLSMGIIPLVSFGICIGAAGLKLAFFHSNN